jgi:hypothetical protein
MTKLRFLLVTVIICFCVIPALAQYTSQQAINLVLSQVLATELEQVDVYMVDVAKAGQNTISLENNKIVDMPYASNWVFFVDDMPFANWAHPCRYIFVDEATGNYQIVNEDFFPVDWKTSYTSISEMDRPTPIDLPVNQNATINGLDPNPNLYAVIINGADQDRYWNDISAIYCTLLDVYGYTKENIFVHYVNGYSTFGNDFDGPPSSDDIDYDAYKTSILHTFSEMAGESSTSPEIPELGPDDGLFIFVDDHGYLSGGHSYINLPGDDLGDWEMAEALEGINCAQIIAVLEPCQIGGFEDELSDYVNYNVSCKNRSIQTASEDESSWAEVWITGANYDEFVYYWTAAARGYYPHDDYPWEESHEVGSFPFYNYPDLVGHPGDHDPDLNGDGFVQMEEAFEYANDLDTWSQYGYWYPYYSGVAEDPQEFTDISYTEDLLSLCGIAGHVSSTQTTVGRNYLVGGDLIVDNGLNLTLGNGSNYCFGNELANINIENNANLIVGNNVGFSGNYNNQLKVDGSIQFGLNNTFNKHGSTGYFYGLVLNNSTMQTTIDDVTFNETQFRNYGAELNITDSEFNDCGWAYSFHGDVTIDNCVFTDTWLYLENQQNDPDILAYVNNSTFNNTSSAVGIDIANYDNYWIDNNDIRANYNGIQIINCGNDNYITQQLYNNTIHDCGWAGVLAYNTKGAFYENHIHDNQTGIKLMNKCNMALYGDAGASTNYGTNFITDNDSYEIYISKYSFPWYFRYNVIIDEDNAGNPTDPMLYFAYPAGSKVNQKDIRYNCWGNNFLDYEDLYPHTYFAWDPTWCPGGSSGAIDAAEQMYTDGREQFESQLYPESKATFMLLIETYPETEYAVSAMKELVNLEKYATNDYVSLKEYYQTNDGIQADTILQKLSVSLANDCDIKLENWPGAIDYYEGIINDPVSLEDSVFAIIDLGYVYFLMENSGYKSAYTGQLTQYKPESREKFFEHRDYLLSLLPGENLSESLKENISVLKEGELLQNVPNPFKGSTQIWYKMESEATVQLNVYNYTGQLVSTINGGTKSEGTHHFDFNAGGLKSGIYFYSISINGQTTDSKKMTIMK